MVERLVYTEDVGSSTLSSRTIYGLLAQLVEQVTLNHLVGGSNPSQSTISKDYIQL